MSIRDFIPAWSVVRQLRGGDRLGLGEAAQSSRQANLVPRTKEADEVVKSICPYCAVGCGQLVHVRDNRIINIEGNPESPINQGTLCPKGAATYQLAVNPNRITEVMYRAPGGTAWEEKPLDWAMDRIAELVKKTRDETFQERTPDGQRTLMYTTAIFSLGGATIDNEWNYLHSKLMRGLGIVAIENQARI